MKPYKIYCFDMDGTLLDSMGEWHISRVGLLKRFGCIVPEERVPWILQHSLQEVLQEFGVDCEWDEIIRQYREEMHIRYLRGIPPKPGAPEFLRHLKQQGVRVCVGTATAQRMARDALEKSGLLEYIEFVTDIEKIGCGKENAEFFQRLAKRAGVRPDEILMFEDALYAMQGAKKAGCGVIAIEEATAAGEKEEICALADRYIHSYFELL